MAPALDSPFYRTCLGRIHVQDALVIVLVLHFFNVLSAIGTYVNRIDSENLEASQNRLGLLLLLVTVFASGLYAKARQSAGALVPMLIILGFSFGSMVVLTVLALVSIFVETNGYTAEVKLWATLFAVILTAYVYWQFKVVLRAFKYYKELAKQPILMTTFAPGQMFTPPPEYDNLMNAAAAEEKKLPVA